MRERLDEVDLNILKVLQAEGRITNAELARRVGLSPPSVHQRVRKLEDTGYIQGYEALLDYQKLGYNLKVYVLIGLSLHQEQPIERFRKAIAGIPEVMECMHVSGDFDFLLKILVKDMPSYEVLVREKISKIRGVGRVQSCFVLQTNKETRQVEL